MASRVARADAARLLRDEGAESLRVRWCDNANLVRAKAVHLPSFLDARPGADDDANLDDLSRAVTISQALMSLPVVADEVVVEAGLPPSHDVLLAPDWSTLTRVPHAPGHLWVAADMLDDGAPWAHCPRGFLVRVQAEAAAAGLRIEMGAELEFYLLQADRDDGGSPRPSDDTPYALDMGFDLHRDPVGAILRSLADQGIPVAQHHPESGPGQYEISLHRSPPLELADAIVSARETIRAVAAGSGLRATFLPVVVDDQAGSAMHVHLSLTGDAADGLGAHGRAFVAGLLDHLPTLLAVTCPSPNSYRRFRAHAWAGAYRAWGYENKEVPLRIVRTPDGEGDRDCEVKAVDGTANPYIGLGCLIAAGLDGIRRPLKLPEPLGLDPADLDDTERVAAGITALPRDPAEPLAELERSSLFRSAMGDLHRSYCAVKRHEQAALADLGPDEQIAALLGRW
jgi:glutamine synthetase